MPLIGAQSTAGLALYGVTLSEAWISRSPRLAGS